MSGVRRSRAAAAAALLLFATACGAQSPAASPTPTAEPSSSSTVTPPPTKGSGDAAPVADPEHAVDPPGPRRGALVYADLMIKDKDALDPDVIDRINALKTVKRSLVLSLGNAGVENSVLNIAAVDPSTYRNFTVAASAELQEQWDRVAGGEVALEKTLAKQLQDKRGYLKLGND
ncbi:MAG: hypothetical protein ABIR39_22955 [Nocardioides sp.]|uniref:hypothetical protein n=1 Tax=Nocardioides sp. TaxID=35761 RepID=UPI003265B12A